MGITTGLVSEPDLHVRALVQVNAFQEANLAGVERQNNGRGACAFTEETHAAQQWSIGNTRGGKDRLLARRQLLRRLDLVRIFDSHAPNALAQFGLVRNQSSLHVPVQAANRGRGKHALRSAPRAHDRVYSCADNGGSNSRRQATILAKIGREEEDLEILAEDIYHVRKAEERRKLEWIVERDISPVPVAYRPWPGRARR